MRRVIIEIDECYFVKRKNIRRKALKSENWVIGVLLEDIIQNTL